MSIYPTVAFVVVGSLSLLVYAVGVAVPSQQPSFYWLDFYMVLAGGWFLINSILFPAYTLYLMYGLIHRVNRFVDPLTHEQVQRRGDEFFHRVHRLVFYSWSATARWMNRRLMPNYDFKCLPGYLRLPLIIHFYWLWFLLFLMVSGFVAMETVSKA